MSPSFFTFVRLEEKENMRLFSYFAETELGQYFYQRPQYFDQYSNRAQLAYALGATLYMPAVRPCLSQDILKQKQNGLTSLVLDLEDAVGDLALKTAESCLIKELLQLFQQEVHSFETLPLIFIRIRDLEQLKRIYDQLGPAAGLLTGVVLPKFETGSGRKLLEEVKQIGVGQQPFYAMPILETEKVIKKETRITELMDIKQLLDEFRENILNVRIGATDFSGLYGIRRNADTTVYDVAILRDCIGDIINVFLRAESPYVISGPVWEYFSSKERMLVPQPRQTPRYSRHNEQYGLKWRPGLMDRNMDGLIREVLLDIANGLTGKTVIHPSHIKIVQALNVISFEEYMDALNIIESATGEYGVRKSSFSNKMNEIKPHLFWARRVLQKSQLYGVLNEEYTIIDLINQEVFV